MWQVGAPRLRALPRRPGARFALDWILESWEGPRLGTSRARLPRPSRFHCLTAPREGSRRFLKGNIMKCAIVPVSASTGLGRIVRGLASVSLAALAGCGTLPPIVPDMARHSSRPVQLDGARGPLTAKQSQAILAQLKSRGEETSIFDRHLALEEGIVGSPLWVGNK